MGGVFFGVVGGRSDAWMSFLLIGQSDVWCGIFGVSYKILMASIAEKTLYRTLIRAATDVLFFRDTFTAERRSKCASGIFRNSAYTYTYAERLRGNGRSGERCSPAYVVVITREPYGKISEVVSAR